MNKQQLASTIWKSANQMRSKIEANEYRDFILGFIFYKYISEKEVRFFRKQNMSDDDIKEMDESDTQFVEYTKNKIGYFISYENLFSTWLSRGSDFDVSDVRNALSAFFLKRCLYKGELIMVLYHGSNMEIRKPKIIPSKRLLDFGTGFYLTSDYMQAKKWAERTTARRETGTPVISVFHAEDEKIRMLNTLMFDSANTEWLKYISANRTDRFTADSCDIVIGPVANDQAIRTVNNYLKGYFSEEIALQLLLPQKLKDQYAFKTELALTALKFEEAKHL